MTPATGITRRTATTYLEKRVVKIKEALKKAKRFDKLKSESLGMYEQDVESLIHWLFIDPETDVESTKTLANLLSAEDWQVEKKEKDR
jgi:hypothetical protein